MDRCRRNSRVWIVLWIDLAGFEPFILFEAMRITIDAIVQGFVLTLTLAGVGQAMKRFAAYKVADTSR